MLDLALLIDGKSCKRKEVNAVESADSSAGAGSDARHCNERSLGYLEAVTAQEGIVKPQQLNEVFFFLSKQSDLGKTWTL